MGRDLIRCVVCLGALAALSPGRVEAAEPDIPSQVADRPGQAVPASSIGAGAVQFSGGFEFSNDAQRQDQQERPDTDRITFPNVLVQWGVLPRLEARLSADGLVWIDERGRPSEVEGSDLELGALFELTRASGWWPDTALYFNMSFPTGGFDNTSNGFDPDGRLVAAWTLPYDLSFTTNLGFVSEALGTEEPGRIFAVEPVLNFTTPLPWGRLGAYCEYFAKLSPDQDNAHSLGGGLTWQVAPDLQLDIEAGGGVGGSATGSFVGAGVTWRIRRPSQ